MKFCFCLMLCIAAFSVRAQKKPATVKPGQAQSEMEKELKELEAEDPEMAKQLRQLMKRQPEKKPVPAKAVVSKYNSLIQPVFLKSPLIKPSPEQAKDRLLWFKGKKINDSTLITQNATLVQFKRKKNQVIVQPDSKHDIFKKIDRQLSRHETRKSGFIHMMASTKNGFYFYPGIISSLEEMDQIQNQFRDLTKNVIELLPFEKNDDQETVKPGKGGIGIRMNSEIPEEVMHAYNEVVKIMERNEPLDFPEPPGRPLDACFNCNSENRYYYYRSVDEWSEKYLEFEKSLSQKAMMVARELDKLDGPDITEMVDKMTAAVDKSFDRTRLKMELLESRYANSIEILPLLILVNLNLLRQENYTGRQKEINEQEITEKIVGYIDKVLKYIREQMPQRNYNLSFNLPLIFGLYQQKLILKESEEDVVEMREHIGELDRFNRFKLNLSMYSSVASKDIQATALVETSSDFYVQLGMADCKYQFFIWGIHPETATESEFYIPLSSKGGVKTQLEDDDNYHTYNYTGPQEMMAVFPYFYIDFCTNAIPDTAYISIVRYKKEITESEARSVLKAYTIDFMGYINLLIVNPDGAEASVPESLNAIREMIELATTPQIPAPTNIAELDAMQDKYWKVIGMRKQQKALSETAFRTKSHIVFDATNFSKTIVDASADSRAGSGGSMNVVEGVIKLRVVHDPLPYKSSVDH